MPKQLNVDLRFNADTSQAKKQIQDLQQTLSKLGSSSSKSLGFDQMNSEIAQATNQVNVLKTQLDRAFNTNTGKLDLTKFTQDMQKNGMSLEKYRDALMQLGPEGTQAFAQLATAISQADIPLRRTNKLLTEMGTVLKNTIKWQISSSAIHGFMGAIQQAYGYAQDLNESLTNISIVTGQSTQQMAQFAERANRAAQSLSTTTTAYTDAALIFYQQGLSDQEVEERTNATIKMAQVTGDSATEVSSYMTAVWNNFDDGSQSLEHFADVITALGAATASSSSEISEGLSKFASIADTVGLSYEYATSALATVVAQTRQSADVVGTAFKTIFARIQDLEQGATLEDGVDLGQYAKSLAKVGVDVLDANGKLREMDSILDDIGQKWGELDEAQRVALAQNVAGQRQYAQFMAIFENWDTFQENLSVANASDGTLQEQADTYAESWEASQKRVRAAMEGIYQSVIDDDFFIDLNDGLAGLLNGVNNLIKAFGGLPGVLSMISGILLRTFSPQAAEGIRNIATNIQLIFGGREKIQAQQKTALALAKDAFVDDSISAEVYQNKITLQEKYLQNAEQLNELERKTVELGIQQVDILGQQAIEAEKVTKATEQELEAIVKQQNLDVASKFTGIQQRGKRRGIIDQLAQGRLNYNDAVESYNASTNGMKMSDFIKLDSFTRDSTVNGNNLRQVQEQVKALGEQLNLTGKYKEHFDKALKTSSVSNFQKELKSALSGINSQVDESRSKLVEAEVHLRKIFSVIYDGDLDKVEEAMNKWTTATEKNTDAQKKQEEALKAQQERIKALNQYMQNASGNQIDWAQKIVNGAQAMMQVSMMINQFKGIIDTVQDENMSGLDKMLSITTSLAMVIPMLVNSYRNLTIVQQAAKISQLDLNVAEGDSLTLLSAQQGQLGLLNAAKILGITITDKMTVADLKEAVAAKIQEKGHWGVVKALTAQTAKTLVAHWQLLLLIAAISAFVVACKFAYEAYNADAIAAEKAQKAATNLADAYNSAAEAYNEMKQTVSDYKSATEALEKLTKGTEEYKDALIEANNAAMQLIENGNLNASDYSWEDGRLVIDSEALTRAQNNAQQQMLNAQAGARMASITAMNANNTATLTNIRRSNDGIISNDIEAAYVAYMTSAGASWGDAVYNGLMSSEWAEESEIERIAERYQEIGDAAYLFSNLYQEATEKMQASIESYCKQVQEATNLTEAYALEIAHANLSTEEYSEDIIDFAAGAYTQRNEELYNSIISTANDAFNATTTYNNSTAQDLFRRSGIEGQLTGLSGFSDATGYIFEYIDATGEAKEATLEQIATSIAASEAISSLGDAADQAAQFLNGISDENQNSVFAQMFANFSNGRVNTNEFAGNYIVSDTINQESLNNLLAYWKGETYNADTLAEDMAEVYRAYGITAEQVEQFANTTESYLGDIQRDLAEGAANSIEALNNYLNNSTQQIQDLYNNSNLNKINDSEAQQILSVLSSAQSQGATEIISDLVSGMEVEELTNFADALSKVNWDTTSTIEFFDIMSDSGVAVNEYSDALEELYEVMHNVTAETIAASAEFYNTLDSIAEKLTDTNDTISPEDYAKIPEYMQQFFALTLDGTYKLLISAQEFRDYLRQSRLDEAVAQRDTLRNYVDNLHQFNYDLYEELKEQTGLSYRTQYHQGTVENAGMPGYLATNWQGENIGYFGTREEAEAAALESYQVLDNIDTDLIQQKVDLIRQFTNSYDDLLNKIGSNFDEGNVTQINEVFDSLITNEKEFNESVRETEAALNAQELAIALSFDNLEDLRAARDEYGLGDGAYNTAAYQIDQAQDTATLDPEEWQEYSEYIREAGNALDNFNDNMSDLEADTVAKSIMKMNDAIGILSSNFEEWNDILQNSEPTSEEYIDSIIQLRSAISQLLDISEDYVSSSFVSNPENLELIGKAAEGDAEAIDDLRDALAEDIIVRLDSELDYDHFVDEVNQLRALIPEDIKVGASLTGTDRFIEDLNRMVAETGMTVDQVNALCDSLGFEANFASEGQEVKTQIPVYRIHHEVQDEGGKPLSEGQPTPHNWSEITWTEQLPDEEASTYAPAFAMTTDGTIPKINSVIRKPSGSSNNLSSSNRGGSKPSGGGGGGKSGSQKKPKDSTGEIERYHVINNQIEDNEKALDRLSKAKDRAYGKARLNAMDAEIAKQRESVELAERKLQEVEKYLELDSGAIAAFGAEFDTNGTIVNYDQLMQQQIDKYNAAVETYNNSAMDENAEAVFQQAEDDYNAFTEALKQYEETQDLWYEQAQAVADAKAEVLQLELEKTNYKVEIGIEWEEEDIARLDFMLKRIEDDAHKAAEAIGLLGERTVDALDKYKVYQQGFADTLKNLGVTNAEDIISRAMGGEDLYSMIGGVIDPNQFGQAVDQLDDYISNMMSSLEDAQDSVDQAFEKVKDLFNENIKQMDTYIEKIEFCQKITKSYMNIVDIVGKKSLGITNEMLRTFNAESVTQAVNNEAAAKAKMDSIQAQLLESQARLAQASGELEQKYWKEIIEEQEKELISATENFHQAWEDALQANLEAFENNIELVIEDFSNAVGDLNAMKAEWDLQKSLTDMWEPEYERWHQLSDLINDINKSVDENENLKYKQDLLGLETEIEQLQEQEAKLSEYDLNYLRLRYEAKLAEIALEEAQNAKSQVRMSRDNEGNYSYVYTADEEAVNNAADDYRNKIYEMEKANEEYIDTLQQQLLEMHDKMLEDIQQAGELYGVGTQAYYDAVARIQETYVGQSEFIQSQMQNVFTNNQRLRDEDIVQYIAYTGDIAAGNVDLQTNFGDTYMGIQTQTDDLQTYFNDIWLPALNETFDNVILKAEEYSQQNEVAMETAGTTMDEFRDRASQDILEVTERTTELTEETQKYGETAVEQFAKAAQAWQTGPGALLDAIQAQAQAIANLAQQYTSLKSQLDAAAQAARDFSAAMGQRTRVPTSIPSIPSSGDDSGGGGSSPYNSNSRPNDKDTLEIYQTIHQLEQGPHNNTTRNQLISLYNQIGRPMSQWPDWVTGRIAFDTGGYTGEWGDDGRLAVLHQKELVLNAKDTSNILTAVDVVRQLANSIDFNTMTASFATANIKSASGNSGTLEQRVEITANFPNATDRNEIEQAFQNIVNMASQYAQRKND